MNAENQKTEETYRLTPKGHLHLLMAVEKNLSGDEIWESLEKFVREQAKAEGCIDGAPCLIFHKGGMCATAQQIVRAVLEIDKNSRQP